MHGVKVEHEEHGEGVARRAQDTEDGLLLWVLFVRPRSVYAGWFPLAELGNFDGELFSLSVMAGAQ